MAVIASQEGLGTATSTYILPRKRINNTTLTFSVRGGVGEIEEEISLEEIIIDRANIYKVNAIEQVDSSLWLGGIEGRTRG